MRHPASVNRRTSKRCLILLTLASLAGGGAACGATVGADEHAMTWEQAGLGFDDLKHYFNTPACEARPRAMLGCLFAIEEVATRLHPPMQIGFDDTVLARIVELHRQTYGDRRRPGAVKLDADLVPHNFDGPLKLEPASADTLLAHRTGPAGGESARAFYLSRNAAIEARLDAFATHALSRAAITWQTLIGDALKRLLAQRGDIPPADFSAELINLQLRIGKTPHDQISTDGMAFGPKRDSKALYGVGVQLAVGDDGALQVARVFSGGPADRAGVKAGDRIVSIDGWVWSSEDALTEARVDKAVARFLDTEASEARIEVARDGSTIALRMPRVQLDDLRLEYEILNRAAQQFLYLALSRFPGGGTLCQRIADLSKTHPQAAGWILDLRDNPGGSLATVTCVAGIFLEPGRVIFYEQDNNGDYRARAHTPGVRQPDLADVLSGADERPLNPALQIEPMAVQMPLAVLVNHRSASASELMAAALQDHGRAWIVGERTFGKGTEQMGEVSASNAHIWSWRDIRTFYRPTRSTIQLNGVLPDFAAFADAATAEDTADFIRERDMFFNPVVPKDNPEWKNARLDRIGSIERCLSSRAPVADGDDRQLEIALRVLECD